LTLKYNVFKKNKCKDKYLLALELAEVKEIADIIFNRLNKKIEVLESIEASVDEKIKILETLIEKAEALNITSQSIGRHDEIVSLGKKGMKSHEIADILDIPVGEVELVLNLGKISRSRHAN
jgi:hypothetical protein